MKRWTQGLLVAWVGLFPALAMADATPLPPPQQAHTPVWMFAVVLALFAVGVGAVVFVIKKRRAARAETPK